MSDNDPETPSQRRNRVDPLTSSPGRDLPPFEEEELIAGEPQNEEEEDDDGEELFGDNMENDYRAMPALDRYDPNILDEGDYDMMSEADRAAAEAAMRKRDRDLGVPADGRMRRGLLYDEDDDEDEPARRRRRLAADRAAEGRIDDDEEDQGMVESIENLEDTRGRTTREHVMQIGPRTECLNRFKNFLRTYVDPRGTSLYRYASIFAIILFELLRFEFIF